MKAVEKGAMKKIERNTWNENFVMMDQSSLLLVLFKPLRSHHVYCGAINLSMSLFNLHSICMSWILNFSCLFPLSMLSSTLFVANANYLLCTSAHCWHNKCMTVLWLTVVNVKLVNGFEVRCFQGMLIKMHYRLFPLFILGFSSILSCTGSWSLDMYCIFSFPCIWFQVDTDVYNISRVKSTI